MKKKYLLLILGFFVVFLIKMIEPSKVSADARCGAGYVCWDSSGGTATVYESCWAGSTGTGYCRGLTTTTGTCECTGSPDCSCTISPISCVGDLQPEILSCTCSDGVSSCSANGACGTATNSCSDGVTGECFSVGTSCGLYGGFCERNQPICSCMTIQEGGCFPSGTSTIGCCYGESATPVPTGPTSTPAPTTPPGTPTPTTVPYFSGAAYDDVNATPIGLGGTDNLCSGDTSSQANPFSGDISISRPGESSGVSIFTANYTITTGSTNSDYTIALDLPFPPPDPSVAWQCACNADPGDPYRCIYTNQTPPTGSNLVNFFVYRANLNNAAWWQTLGGHIYSETNIQTSIPSLTCLAPDCIPALIGSDTAGVQDSAGFPTTNTGDTITTITGDTYIHEADSRTTSLQGQAQGVSMPTEDYIFFSGKMIGQAQTLSNATKPTPASNPGIYLYTGDLTITEASSWNVANTEQIIVFVTGNLTFDDTTNSETRLATVATGGTGYLQFIVSGNITVNPSVGYTSYTTDPTQANIALIEGVYIADGLFTIQGEAAATDRKFIGAGTFVGWSGVQLERNFDDGATPTYNNEDATETFIFRPDFLVNAPQIIKSAHINWQEVAPQWPGQ